MSNNKNLQKIWSKISKDDTSALGELYDYLIDDLFNYGHYLTNDHQIIEDAIHDVFIQLWNKRKQITIHSSVKFYLIKAFRRNLIPKLEHSHKVLSSEPDQFEELVEDEPSVGKYVFFKDKLDQKIKALSPREQEAIYLKYFENMDYEEMAQIMGLKIHAIHKLVSRGIIKMRKSFKPK